MSDPGETDLKHIISVSFQMTDRKWREKTKTMMKFKIPKYSGGKKTPAVERGSEMRGWGVEGGPRMANCLVQSQSKRSSGGKG